MVIHPGDPGLVFLHQLGLEGAVTIARRTQFQRAIAGGNGFCEIAVAGVGTRFRLMFTVAEVMEHFGVEAALNVDFFQQAIELVEIVRGFEIFGQFVSQSLQLFFVHKVTCF